MGMVLPSDRQINVNDAVYEGKMPFHIEEIYILFSTKLARIVIFRGSTIFRSGIS